MLVQLKYDLHIKGKLYKRGTVGCVVGNVRPPLVLLPDDALEHIAVSYLTVIPEDDNGFVITNEA